MLWILSDNLGGIKMDNYTQHPGKGESSPVDIYIAKQSVISTPIVDFSRKLNNNRHQEIKSLVQPIPPQSSAGEYQYAFQVDLDRCSGCKACVSACHSMNGLGHDEAWRDVGALIGETQTGPYFQTITTACHHCLDPACANGCPVLAYEKDPITGIVRHLDDQCIGCQYCVLKCPYDVPKFSKELGIVRKCDMCYSRLENGENTACVNACPTSAISIISVAGADVKDRLKSQSSIMPGTHVSSYTLPTTRYVSTLRAIPPHPYVQPADFNRPKKEHAHWPLIHFLIWTQISVGLVMSSAFLQDPGQRKPLLIGASIAGLLGIISSIFHLGKPLKAWRIFLGLRKSWLSREAVTFGFYISVVLTAVITAEMGDTNWINVAILMSMVSGLAGVYTSVMLYHDTQRSFWSLPLTGGCFFTSVVMAMAVSASVSDGTSLIWSLLYVVSSVIRLSRFLYIEKVGSDPLHRLSKSLQSIKEFNGDLLLLNYTAIILSSALFIIYTVTGYHLWASLAAVFSIVELYSERYIFFTNSDAGCMPGGL